MPSEKLQKINEIKQYLNLPTNRSTYFTRDQMVSVIKALRGDSQYVDSHVSNLFEKNLASAGWVKQTTSDSHPTAVNLDILFRNLTQRKAPFSSDLDIEFNLENTKVEQVLIDKINSSQLRTISLEEGVVTMTFV